MGKRARAKGTGAGRGARQKLAAAVAAGDVEPNAVPAEARSGIEKQSQLASLLVHMVLWGEMSASCAQRVAWAAHADGCNHKDVERIAHMGTSGMFPGNVWRDLVRWLPKPPLRRALDTLMVPLTVVQGVRKVIKEARSGIKEALTYDFFPTPIP